MANSPALLIQSDAVVVTTPQSVPIVTAQPNLNLTQLQVGVTWYLVWKLLSLLSLPKLKSQPRMKHLF